MKFVNIAKIAVDDSNLYIPPAIVNFDNVERLRIKSSLDLAVNSNVLPAISYDLLADMTSGAELAIATSGEEEPLLKLMDHITQLLG